MKAFATAPRSSAFRARPIFVAPISSSRVSRSVSSAAFSNSRRFPNYRYKAELPAQEDKKVKTCDDVFRSFLANCEMRVAMDDMSHATLHGYRKILESVWSPKIGGVEFQKVIYSELADIAAAHTKKKKTYNNVVSAVRTAFKFGYRDHPGKFNPTLALPTFRITRKDRPKVDPFVIEEAERIIAASHSKFGEPYGNYEEFRFFTGLRQSEQFALEVGDCDLKFRDDGSIDERCRVRLF